MFNKLNKITITHDKEQPEELTTILTHIFKQLDETCENVILSHTERKHDQAKINEFIKQQELNHTIIWYKLDNILKAVT